jgi:outer membrane protein assembly factor BamB
MSIYRFAVLLSLLSCSFASAAPDSWISDSKDKTWQPEILWSTATGNMNGDVTIAGDYLLVGGNNGVSGFHRNLSRWNLVLTPRAPLNEDSNAMICLDAKTGALRWRAVHPQLPDHSIGIPGFGITSKPAVAGDRVYYLSVNWEFVCVDLEGFRDGENDRPVTVETLTDYTDADIIWKIDLRKDLGVVPRCAGDIGYVQSSPLVMDGLVYAVTGNGADWHGTSPHAVPAPDAPSFLAVDRFTGKIAWSSNAPGKNITWMQGGSPVAMPERGEVVFPGGDGCLYGFDARSGKQHWKADLNAIGGTKELFFECTPLVVNNMVIASLRHCIEMGPQAAPLIAVKPGKAGEPVQVVWVTGRERGGFSAQALVQGGIVFVISAPVESGGTYLLHAIDPDSGKEKWKLAVGKTSDSMSIGSDGRLLYLANEDNELIIVEPGATPRVLRSLEFSGRGISPRSSRAVTSDFGLCLPLEEGVLMVRMP